jgi:multicomponent Na+:H+ antiporter subunit D
VLPGLPGAATAVGARFVDGPGYVASVLDATRPATPGPPPTLVPHAHGWTLDGVALGLVSTALAIAGAFAMVWRPTDDSYRARLMTITRRTVRPAVRALERVHSGHIGDYVAWLLFGMAAFAALLALPP